jgi:HlyD family secretion protein
MQLRKLVPFAVLAAILTVALFYLLRDSDDPNVLRASGTIEATDVDVSFQLAGRVIEVVVTEGQTVQKGDLLARLAAEELEDRVNQLQAALDAVASQARQQETTIALRSSVIENQIAQARSQSDAARSVAQRVREGARPQEIRVAEAELNQAEATLAQRQADFERIAALFKEGIVAGQQYEAADTARRTAETHRQAAAERLALAREGSRREDILEADARTEAAEAAVGVAVSGLKEIEIQREALLAAKARERELQAQLEAAKIQLGRAEIRSPLAGVVLTKNVESGEVVSAGTPVVTIANIDDLWMNIYIPENRTGLIRLGQPARVRTDSFPNEWFQASVTFISSESEFTPKTILTEEERVKLVYRVKISFADTGQRLKPGMPADAEVVLNPPS